MEGSVWNKGDSFEGFFFLGERVVIFLVTNRFIYIIYTVKKLWPGLQGCLLVPKSENCVSVGGFSKYIEGKFRSGVEMEKSKKLRD